MEIEHVQTFEGSPLRGLAQRAGMDGPVSSPQNKQQAGQGTVRIFASQTEPNCLENAFAETCFRR